MWILVTAFAVSFLSTLAVIRWTRLHPHRVQDHHMGGPQKFHAAPVPRIGGMGIVGGIAFGAALLSISDPPAWTTGWLLLACSFPAFAAGIAEDLTKRIAPRHRLLFASASAALAFWLCDAQITRTAIPGLDWVVSYGLGAALVTVFVVTGVANSINIIDGFNGLASMCVVLMLICVAYVAFEAGDELIAWLAIAGVGGVLGFFFLNFPAGLVFLGDGGAYFLGFYLAELAILLLHRNPTVSPMFPLLLCSYPIVETLFSIYRRKVLQGRPAALADGAHLHSLIYRRFLRWAGGSQTARELTRRNSMTATYLWMLCLFSVIPAVLWWNSTPVLTVFIAIFSVSYVSLYWRIVRFKAPRWLLMRR